ncbi:MAG: Disulfide bond formation protein C [Candidatus Anoxychlamydiales bacterium]|nr:Disulfide bond formation protein C [Candidatus Anoxychlamydiales bacterium]NGX41174.1 Disulfide bond formation protein C [Candidatus Anoxychlamydiales bacterium]HEU64083.1 disulfide bond formation protein B [Chlamydiota bacterium]
MIKFIKRFSLYFAWTIALIATIGSLYSSQILNIKPCVFCWYQRAFMFPLAIILGVAAYKKDGKIFPYIIALPIIGAMVASVQSLFSYFNITSLVCGLECSGETQKLFGFLDMSIASFVAFSAIIFLLMIAKKKK